MSTESRPPADEPRRPAGAGDDTAHLDPVTEPMPAGPPPATPPPAVPSASAAPSTAGSAASAGSTTPGSAGSAAPPTTSVAAPASASEPAAMGSAPAEGAAAAPGPAGPPPPPPGPGWYYAPGGEAPRGPRRPWRGRVSPRAGLGLGLAALLIACLCGGLGLVVGAAVSHGWGDGGRGDRHGYFDDRSDRDGPGPDGRRNQPPFRDGEGPRRVPRNPGQQPQPPTTPATPPAPSSPSATPTT